MTIREDRHGNVVQASRPYSSQVLAIGGSSVASVTFSVNQNRPVRGDSGGTQPTVANETRHVRVVCTAPAWISFGVAPVAVKQGASSMYIPAGLPEYFWVMHGEQIAVIQDAAAGSCYITELYN